MLTYKPDDFLAWPALYVTAIALFFTNAVAGWWTVNGRTGRWLIRCSIVLQTAIGWLQHGFFRIQVPFLTRWWNKPTVIRIATRGQSCYATAGFKRFSHLYKNLLLDHDTSNLNNECVDKHNNLICKYFMFIYFLFFYLLHFSP